jgi:hypothetical protein
MVDDEFAGCTILNFPFPNLVGGAFPLENRSIIVDINSQYELT